MTAVSMSLAGSSRPWRPIRVSALTRAWTALTVASGAIVFTEPAPYDVLMLGLIGLLTLTGLQRYTRLLGLYLGLWLACVAGASLATMASADLARSATHSAVSLYLSLSSFVLAAFVACSPRENGTLVMRACVAAAVLAAAAGIAGYVDALPGAFELLTKFGRASGTFKDPNVLGAFLVPPTLYLAHLLLTRPAARTVLPLTGLVVLTSAVLLSFSRGAWLNLATALIVYGYLRFITALSHRVRLRLACLGMLAILFAAAAVAAALQIDAVGSLFAERAELAQGYDLGPDGRFGGQEKASSLALVSPAGIGALQFASLYHHEDVHNVYLSMFLNAGWLGGLLYVCLIGLSIGLGLAHALRPSAHRGLFLVAYAAAARMCHRRRGDRYRPLAPLLSAARPGLGHDGLAPPSPARALANSAHAGNGSWFWRKDPLNSRQPNPLSSSFTRKGLGVFPARTQQGTSPPASSRPARASVRSTAKL